MELRKDLGGWQVRWDEDMVRRAVAEGSWPQKTVAEFARERTQAHPSRTLITEAGRQYSCSELYAGALRLACFFSSRGLVPGDVVSFQLPNWHEANIINLAAAMTGVVVNPIVPIFRDTEVGYILNDSGSKLVFVPQLYRRHNYVEMLERLRPSLQRPIEAIIVRGEARNGHVSFDQLLAAQQPLDPLPIVDPNAVKLVMYTSGTTGRPKGVLHTHNTIHAENFKTVASIGLSDQDVMFNASPVTHITGALYALNLPWYADVPIVLLDTWDAGIAFDLMDRHRCTCMAGATPFLQDLIAEAKKRNATLPQLRAFTCGGAGVPPALIYEAAQIFPNCHTWRAFGATEIPTITVRPEGRDRLQRSAETDGRIWRAEVKVLDLATGAALPAGEEGEIAARAPNMAIGYANPADNEAYDGEGYFRMGDVGRIIDGHIVITGRKKDLIIRAGENISPREIEEVLLQDPTIADVAVVSMPSHRTGEAICAFVVARSGARVDLDSVTRIMTAAGLARQKIPEHIELVDELPRTAAGKVRKDVLRERSKEISRQARPPAAAGMTASP